MENTPQEIKKSERRDQTNDRQRDKVAGFWFGVIFLTVMLTFTLWVPSPTETQWFVFRVVLALAAAGIGSVIPGLIVVSIPTYVRAGGAIALFVLVFLMNPPNLLSPTAPIRIKNSQIETHGDDSGISIGNKSNGNEHQRQVSK